MIVDEEEVGQRFLIDLLRMEGNGDIRSKTKDTLQAFGENVEDILMELELSDPEINEPDFSLDNLDSQVYSPEPIVAITRHPLSDSRKNWKISKIIIGTRRCYSA
jgi:hypothetical protein